MRISPSEPCSEVGCCESERIDNVIREIRRVEQEMGWKRVLQIDALLVRLREGDAEGAHCSLRRLASNPECPLSKSQLREIVEAARVYKEDPTIRSARHVSPSHAAIVASLPLGKRQSLLQRAEARKLGVRELRDLARESRRELGDRRGRPVGSSADKAITRYDNAVLQLEEALELASAGNVGPEAQQRLVKLLARIRELYLQGVERFVHCSEEAGRSIPAQAIKQDAIDPSPMS